MSQEVTLDQSVRRNRLEDTDGTAQIESKSALIEKNSG